MNKTKIALAMRRMGAGKLIESPKFRRAVGAPLYKRHSIEANTTLVGRSTIEAKRVTPEPAKLAKTSPRKHLAVADPQLSIVVPAYNVEGYIEQTLSSLAAQSFEDFEIIVVDDGSSDNTLARVLRFSESDGRIRVISKVNAGLGAARNTGLEASNAPYIAFIDSDDLVPRDAFETMMSTIQASGSDVVIGAVERFDSRRYWTPAWVNLCHDRDRIGIQATDLPEILWDVFAWNKIFRRSSWDELVGRFPEGILYEDQECTGKLFVEGAKLDVLSKTVYSWRLRDDGTSITQQKTSIRDLSDRISVIQTMSDLMEKADGVLRAYWYSKVFTDDFYWYLIEVPRVNDPAFWQMLKDEIVRLFRNSDPESFDAIPLDRRLLILSVALGSREDFDLVLDYFQEFDTKGQITVRSDGPPSISAPIIEQLSFEIPDELLEVSASNLQATAIMRRYSTGPEGILLSGDVRVDGLDGSLNTMELSAELVPVEQSSVSQAGVPIPIQRHHSDEAMNASTDPLNDYSSLGFTLSLDNELTDSLPLRYEPGVTNRWKIRISVLLADGTSVVCGITKRDSRGSAGRLTAGPLTSGRRRMVPVVLHDNASAVEVIELETFASTVSVAHSEVSITLESTGSEDLRGLLVTATNSTGKTMVSAIAEGSRDRVVAVLKFPRMTQKGNVNSTVWELKYGRPGGVAISIPWKSAEEAAGSERFLPVSTGFGFLRLIEHVQQGLVTSAEVKVEEGTLTIGGDVYFDPQIRASNPTFALVSKARVVKPIQTQSGSDGSFQTIFKLTEIDSHGRQTRLECDLYTFQMLTPTGQSLPTSVWMPCSESLIRDFPADYRGTQQRVLLSRTPEAGALAVDLRAPLKEDESGAYQQQLLRNVYTGGTSKLEAATLFQSFGGHSVQDSPLAIDLEIARRHPEIKRYWTVRDYSVAVPEGATPVVMYSREWHEALSSSKFLVNNGNFPAWFRKRPGQFYLQTWHGTPLKKIGNDVPAQNLSLSYRALMERESREYWDVLLAQSPWAAETLRRAFSFDGVVLDEGYPRNDALQPGPTSDARREAVRKYFGATPGQPVVLYAPTWRDNLRDAKGRYKHQMFLEPKELRKKLGSDLIILMRGHSNTLAGRGRLVGPNTHEVSTYPDVNDLILAADVLITDYSSIMFDYVVTGKPIVYLAPDIDDYRDSTRGFYFDFESSAPGAICSTSSEVASQLKAIFEGFDSQTERYVKFQRDFARFDDGEASKRVVSYVWG